MIVYAVAFALSLILYIAVARGKKMASHTTISVSNRSLHSSTIKIREVPLAVFLAALPPTFVSACRYYVGTDYLGTYYTGFYRILEGSTVDRFEFGYYWLNRLIQMFTENVFVLFAITAIIYIGVTYKTILDASVDIPLSITLFLFTRYYFAGMNGIRQFIAMAILTYSIKYIIGKEPKRFAVCVFIAISFHYISVLFIPVYFVGRLKLTKSRIFKWTVIDVGVFTLGTGIIFRILEGTKYGRLLSRLGVAGIKFTIFTVAINAILLYLAYSDYSKRNNDEKYRVYLNIQLIAFLVSLVLRTIPLMERVYWFFSFPIIISFPYFLLGKKGDEKKLWKYAVLTIFFVYMVYDIVILGDHSALPYQWVFGKTPTHYAGWNWYGR